MKLTDRVLGPLALWQVILVASAFAMTFIVYYIPRAIDIGIDYHYLGTSLDRAIPFVAWTSLIYVLSYVLWVANYIIASTQDEGEVRRFFVADFICKVVCMIAFVVFPTAIVRPDVAGDGIFEWLTNLIYSLDVPDNLLPSMHCTQSWFAFIAVRCNPRIPKGYKAFTLVFVMLIVISTLTTKQHYVVDAIAGVLLAEVVYQAVCLIMDRREKKRYLSPSA